MLTHVLNGVDIIFKCLIHTVMETETLVMMNTNRRRMVLKPLSPALLKNKEQNSTSNTNERIPVSFLDYRSFFYLLYSC